MIGIMVPCVWNGVEYVKLDDIEILAMVGVVEVISAVCLEWDCCFQIRIGIWVFECSWVVPNRVGVVGACSWMASNRMWYVVALLRRRQKRFYTLLTCFFFFPKECDSITSYVKQTNCFHFRKKRRFVLFSAYWTLTGQYGKNKVVINLCSKNSCSKTKKKNM